MATQRAQRNIEFKVEKALSSVRPRPDTADTISRYRSRVLALPQVESGAVDQQAAENWLEVAASIYSGRGVAQLIKMASGFGAQDIRSLYAHANKEYYPGYGASEVIGRKRLEAVPAPASAVISGDRIIENFSRIMVLEKLGMTRDTHAESSLATPNPESPVPFMIARASLIAQADDTRALIDFHIDAPSNRLAHDEVTLNYLDLCAANQGIDIGARHLAHVKITDELYNSIVAMSAMSLEAKNLLGEMAREAANSSLRGLEVSVEPVTPSPQLMQDLADIGREYWSAVVQGTDVDLRLPPKAELTPELAQHIEQAQKAHLAAQKLRVTAQSIESKAKADLEDAALAIDFTDNLSLPMTAPAVRRRTDLDAEAAAEYIQSIQGTALPEDRLYDAVIDTDRLAAAYREGVRLPIEEFQIRGAANRAKVESVASLLGVSLEPLMVTKYAALSPTKTRGPEFEAIQAFAQPYAEELKKMHRTASADPALDVPELKTQAAPEPEAPAQKARPKSTMSM